MGRGQLTVRGWCGEVEGQINILHTARTIKGVGGRKRERGGGGDP